VSLAEPLSILFMFATAVVLLDNNLSKSSTERVPYPGIHLPKLRVIKFKREGHRVRVTAAKCEVQSFEHIAFSCGCIQVSNEFPGGHGGETHISRKHQADIERRSVGVVL